jgi:hypothetical protein
MKIMCRAFNQALTILFISFSLFLSGCGTSNSVTRLDTGVVADSAMYIVGSCDVKDSRASEETCTSLQDQVGYALLKQGLYDKTGKTAKNIVNFTITNFRNVGAVTRGALGPMAGSDSLNIEVVVVDRETNKIIDNTTISTFNITAINTTEKSMIRAVSYKIVDYLTSRNDKI